MASAHRAAFPPDLTFFVMGFQLLLTLPVMSILKHIHAAATLAGSSLFLFLSLIGIVYIDATKTS